MGNGNMAFYKKQAGVESKVVVRDGGQVHGRFSIGSQRRSAYSRFDDSRCRCHAADHFS